MEIEHADTRSPVQDGRPRPARQDPEQCGLGMLRLPGKDQTDRSWKGKTMLKKLALALLATAAFGGASTDYFDARTSREVRARTWDSRSANPDITHGPPMSNDNNAQSKRVRWQC